MSDRNIEGEHHSAFNNYTVDSQSNKKHLCHIPYASVKEFMAEFLGTTILITIGVGTVAQVVLSDTLQTPSGEFVSIAWGFGIAVMIGVIVTAKTSGGHLNPAVTVAFAIFKKISPWYKCLYYMAGQYLGAFFGSMIVYSIYYDAFQEVGYSYGTSKIFTTHPAKHISILGVIIDESISTAILLLSICAITDKNNLRIPRFIQPFLIGLVVFVLCLCYSFNSGAALNPARDLGPRVFTSIFGWGLDPFMKDSYYWITIIFATHVGGILGVLIYQMMIGWQMGPQDEVLARNQIVI